MSSIRLITAFAIISFAACTSASSNDDASPAPVSKSPLFSTGTLPTIVIGSTHVPVNSVPHRTRIENSGELCLQTNPVLPEIIATMTPSGCWGSGCYEIIETELRLRFAVADMVHDCEMEANDQTDCEPKNIPSLYASSLFFFAARTDRTICSTDCSGIKPVENRIMLEYDSRVNVFLGDHPIGVFDPREPTKQCFKSASQVNEGELLKPQQ